MEKRGRVMRRASATEDGPCGTGANPPRSMRRFYRVSETRIEPGHRPCDVYPVRNTPMWSPAGVGFPDARSDFPHKRILFPAPLKKFPVRRLRELALRTGGISGVLGSPIGRTRREIAKFPVFSRGTGKIDVETGSLETGPSANQSVCPGILRSCP